MLVMIMAMMTMTMTTSHSSSLTLHSSPFQPSSQWHLAVVMSTSSDQFKEGLVIWLNENGIKGKHQTRHARVDVATQVSLNDRIIEKVRHPSVGEICLISRYRKHLWKSGTDLPPPYSPWPLHRTGQTLKILVFNEIDKKLSELANEL